MKKNKKILQKYVVEYALDVLKKMQKKIHYFFLYWRNKRQ